MQQRIHRLFFDRGKLTTKQSCAINQNFCDRSPCMWLLAFQNLAGSFFDVMAHAKNSDAKQQGC
ncbi:hypothetical protein [Clostridium sp. J1101437_171009_A5]|uniref:hypothetical protein n=1 Tax=Clostridium sp. J1101437_171009_A5 TaxID=2787098 RepID=UPI00189C2EB3|nr:hypothetical protein [Clostridium sp. J1101437_171009_A5]